VVTPRGAILALLLAGVLFSSIYPIRRYFAVRSSITQLRHEEHALDQRQQDLQTQKALLQTDGEVERIARAELNMVKPGEIAFAVLAPSSRPSQSARVGPAGLLAPENAVHRSIFSRVWGAVARAAHTI
jgi:cell division protein FtsB